MSKAAETVKDWAAMWISVKDRLPKLDETVLVCRRSGYDGAAIYQFGGRFYESGEGWLWACGGQYGITPGDNLTKNDIEPDDDYQITHWMPLPCAPYRRRKHIGPILRMTQPSVSDPGRFGFEQKYQARTAAGERTD